MSYITFIYKLKGVPQTYYGKYISNNISDDHEGLDLEVKNVLIYGLNQYRTKNNIPKIRNYDDIIVGIMSYFDNSVIPAYSTEAEIKCFDFYCSELNNDIKCYVNGDLL